MEGATGTSVSSAPWPMLGAKWSVPKQRGLVIPRQRLLDHLSEGTQGPLTVLAGPAGCGKTTLLACWAAQDGPSGHLTWLTLDPDDDQPGVFWAYVVEALRRHGVPLPATVALPLHPGPVDRSFLRSLAASLADSHDPVVLVLDQFESITDERVLRDLDFVLRHAAPQLHLVLSTRREPGGPFARYAVTGDVTRIRPAELAFTTEEATALLAQHDVHLPEAALAGLQQQLEGWAAGLRLSAVAIRGGEDPRQLIQSLPVGRTELTDYLVEEVLEAQPRPVQDFLMLTCVVDRLTPDLAVALTGRADSGVTLQDLTKANALVEAADGPAVWYRYHPLLSHTLRAELHRHHPDAVARQHLRAARWYGRTGDYVQAARHAAAAGDWQKASTMIVRGLGLVPLLEGRADPSLVAVLEQTPEDASGVMVELTRAAMAAARLEVDAALASVSGCEEHQLTVPPADVGVVRASAALVRLVVARRLLDDGMAHEAYDVLESELSRLQSLGPALAPARALGLCSLAGAQLWGGDFEGAEPALRAALAASRRPGCEYSLLMVLGQKALWAYRQGHLREAAELGRQALRLAQDSGLPARYQTGVGHLALSMVALDWNDRLAAQRHLKDADLTAEAASDPALRAVVGMLEAFYLALDGHGPEALTILADVETTADRAPLPVWMRSRVVTAEAAVRLRSGDPWGALSTLDRAATRTDDWHLTRAAAAYATGDVATALEIVEPVVSGGQPTIHGGIVEALVLAARISLDQGEVPKARRTVLEALHTARPEGRRRPFVEARSWLLPLISSSPDLEKAASWLGVDLVGGRADGRSSDFAPVLVEPLTDRERDVLSRMAHAMSPSDIAGDLHVSVNTVKTHQKSLYRKLSVRRAADAVRRGRTLQLI